MHKILIDQTGEMWLFRKDPEGFTITLTVETAPVKNITRYQTAADNRGNHHVVLERNLELEYCHWNGRAWSKRTNPGIRGAGAFYLAVLAEGEPHLLAVRGEKERKQEFYHLIFRENQWWPRKLDFLQGTAGIKAFFPWTADSLMIIYEQNNPLSPGFGLALFTSDNWLVKTEISSRSRFLNWFFYGDYLGLLLGRESLCGLGFNLYTLARTNGQIISEMDLGRVEGWDLYPGFYQLKGDLKLCWQYRGRLYIADLRENPPEIANITENTLFYPASLLIPLGQPVLTDYLFLDKVRGELLSHPLKMKLENLQRSCANSAWRPSRSHLHDLQPRGSK